MSIYRNNFYSIVFEKFIQKNILRIKIGLRLFKNIKNQKIFMNIEFLFFEKKKFYQKISQINSTKKGITKLSGFKKLQLSFVMS